MIFKEENRGEKEAQLKQKVVVKKKLQQEVNRTSLFSSD